MYQHSLYKFWINWSIWKSKGNRPKIFWIDNYIIFFPVVANNGIETAKIVRQFPRVKHHHKDAIISVRKITDDEFNELTYENSKNLYLKCATNKNKIPLI